MTFSILNPRPLNYLLLFVLVCSSGSAVAQLQVQDATSAPFTPTNLISNVFLGSGVEVTSIQYKGANEAIGYFSNATAAIGIDRGIVLTTGSAETRPGWLFGTIPGIDGVGSSFMSHDNGSNFIDPDLQALLPAPESMKNTAVYTIKFIPTSDTLRFRYSFASEEYPEYACSEYNDVFGFFIKGPGYPNFTNIAKVPGTNQAVSINNIHPSNSQYPNCGPKNLQYYNNNNLSNKQPIFDGYTDVLTAMAVVTPCVEYTIKLAIGDVSDALYDSGVFLEAKSFSTRTITHDVLTQSNDATITEGCSDGSLVFHIPDLAEYTIPMDIKYFGTGTNGVDVTTLPSQVAFATGTNKIEIPLHAILDNLTEGQEFIGVDYAKDACTRDTVYIYIRENSLLPPTLPEDTTVCLAFLSTYFLDATSPTPAPAPVTFSNITVKPISPANTAIFSDIQVFGVQPSKIGAGVIESVCLNINHPYDQDLDVFLVAPNGAFIELTTDNGGTGDNYINTCFSESATQSIITASAPFTGSFVPEGQFSDLFGGNTNGTWRLQITDDETAFTGDLVSWSITFSPSYTIDYTWSPSATVTCADCPATFANPTESTDYEVVLTDNYGCMIKDTFSVDVITNLAAPSIDCITPTPSSVTFSWPDVPGAASYEINVGGSGWQPIPSGPNTYTVNGLGSFSAVNIQLQAVGNMLCSALVATGTCTSCEVPTVQSAVESTSCSNIADGSVLVSPNGLNGPYTFTLDSITNITGSFDKLAGGDYSVVVTDMSGCSIVENITIPSPDTLIGLAILVQNASCFGSSNASVQAQATGGTGTISYAWSNGKTSEIISGIPANTYSVIVKDAMGCQDTSSIVVSQPLAIVPQTSGTAARCFGEASGTLSASAVGGTGTLIYTWENGLFGQNITNIAAGTYKLTVTDANGCTSTGSQTIGQATQINTILSIDSTSCHDRADGSVKVVATGGANGFTYAWSDPAGQTSATAQNLPVGNYIVIVSDANNCTTTATATVKAPTALVFTNQITDTKCNGNADGVAKALPSGGTAPYNYLWSNGQSSAQATGLSAAQYGITVSDANGCTNSKSVTIQEPASIDIGLVPSATKCFGGADGRITSSLLGGVGTFTYLWSNGTTSPNLQNVAAGNYQVTATDTNGCSSSKTATVTQPTGIALTLSIQDARCFGDNTGTGIALGSGGIGAFSYRWSGPNGYQSNVATPNNLAAGQYQVIATDANGCTHTETTQIGQPVNLVASMPSISDTICYLAADGTATVYPSGGVPPYSFIWNTNDLSTQSVQGLQTGQFTVFVTDANGCVKTANTFVAQLEELTASVATEKPSCHDGTDGTATILSAAYGQTTTDLSKLRFEWNTTPVQTSAIATGLLANKTYQVRVIDAQGCAALKSVSIGNPTAITLATDSSGQVDCFGGNNGWAAVSAAGGNAPYAYRWGGTAGNQTAKLAQNLAAGQYNVTITDNKQCTQVQKVNIIEPSDIHLFFEKKNVKCFGETNGEAKALASGGTAPFTFLWENGATAQEAKDLPKGLYKMTTTDTKGCTDVSDVEIDAPDAPISGDIIKRDAVCFNEKNGEIHFTCAGGTAPYRYSLDGMHWNGSPIQIALGAGIYQPQVQDYRGCLMHFDPVEITQRNAITVDIGRDTTILLGSSVQLFANVENAVQPIEYIWSSEDSIWLSCMDCPDPFVDSLYDRNDFDLFIIDANGCFAEDRITINVRKERRVFVPTGFTPNGDFNNDVLLTHGDPRVHVLQFRIYDRWGELVFEAADFKLTDTSVFWDGTFRGEKLNPATYVWTMEVQYIDRVQEVFKGTTHLIR